MPFFKHRRYRNRPATSLGLFSLLVLAIVALMLFSVIVTASAAPAGTVSLKPVYNDLVNPFLQDILEGIGSFMAACAAWIMALFARHLPQALADGARYRADLAVRSAITEGIAIAMRTVTNAEDAHSDIRVHGAVQRCAANYAIEHAGAYVDRLGLGPDQLAMKVLQFLPPQPAVRPVGSNANQASMATADQRAVDTAPLPPVPGAKTDFH